MRRGAEETFYEENCLFRRDGIGNLAKGRMAANVVTIDE